MKNFSKFLTALVVALLINFCAVNKIFAQDTTSMSAEAVELLNELRIEHGLNPLEWNPNSNLQMAAQLRAEEIVEEFSHTRPDGTSCFTVFRDFNLPRYRNCGENIAMGTNLSAEGAMELWINSQGHYKNMVTPEFQEIGLGCFVHGDEIYWVQLFFTRQ